MAQIDLATARRFSQALYEKIWMREVFEIELWSRPGTCYPDDHGKDLKTKIDIELCIEKDLINGLSFIPAASDTTNLLHALNENELKITDFERYCKSNNLEPRVSINISSAKFLEFCYGRALAWLHIPHSPEGLESLGKI